ncbi:CBS domain-containing protein [Methanococcoides burtonii]|uniref:Cystathionine beta-synthase domain-containing protein n=1 Tax=Methanococcoides burtonii (strain DSM 6242 / NBRC 107633 / OCM 468 / ACE-M) TaxID=259564 RepID=Q12V74_METBU|nr:CBS domain-containing protein [Methanococcoides burtonii]ABE52652.1 Cystathionine beta-synthase domain-containing protein [Methanococcoides burtonii DSM 6242]
MKVNEIMSKDAVCVKEHDNMTHARQLMRDHFLRGLPVTDANGKMVGILKDQDILNITSTRSNVTIGGFVHDCPLITPKTDIMDAARLIIESGVGRCPIVRSETEREIVGILSNSDILANIGSNRINTKVAADVMTTDIISCNPHDLLTKIWPILLTSNYSGLPVVTNADELQGMITIRDIIRFGFIRPAIGDKQQTQTKDVPSVDKIMSTPAYTVLSDTSVKECVEKMLHYDVGRLTVVNDGKVIGIVSRTDILRASL